MLKLFDKPFDGKTFPASGGLLGDLALEQYLGIFFADPARYLTGDPEAILERNAAIKNLAENRALYDALGDYLAAAESINESARSGADVNPLQSLAPAVGVWRLRESVIAIALSVGPNDADAFKNLAADLKTFLSERFVANIDSVWEAFAAGINNPASLALRADFSEDLSVASVTLTQVSDKRCAKNGSAGKPDGARQNNPGNADTKLCADALYAPAPSDKSHDFLLRGQVLALESLANELSKSVLTELSGLTEDARFAVGAAAYAKRIGAYAKCACYAKILPSVEKTLTAKNMAHPFFAECAALTKNSVSIARGGELILLGGKNRGGKTTFLQTAGAMQVLFQMGLPLPAESAEISPASGVFAVFARDEAEGFSRERQFAETQTSGERPRFQGKLGRELAAMRDALSAADEFSLLLANEPISGTSPDESYYLSKESVGVAKANGVRGIWVTHLYRLFDDAAAMNAFGFGSRVACYRTAPGDGQKEFTIEPGVPEYYSGATELLNG
ncbi:MAG: hypothetical protein FWF03_07895 [Defluviitaleaceae bacterium]|nr:hypothetical protein [Defluviitaleaceae bacterium]